MDILALGKPLRRRDVLSPCLPGDEWFWSRRIRVRAPTPRWCSAPGLGAPPVLETGCGPCGGAAAAAREPVEQARRPERRQEVAAAIGDGGSRGAGGGAAAPAITAPAVRSLSAHQHALQHAPQRARSLRSARGAGENTVRSSGLITLLMKARLVDEGARYTSGRSDGFACARASITLEHVVGAPAEAQRPPLRPPPAHEAAGSAGAAGATAHTAAARGDDGQRHGEGQWNLLDGQGRLARVARGVAVRPRAQKQHAVVAHDAPVQPLDAGSLNTK